MKALLFILLLISYTTVSGQGLLGGFSIIEPVRGQYGQEIQELLEWGAQQVLATSIGRGRLPAGSYSVTQVYRVEEQVVNGKNYRYTVELAGETLNDYYLTGTATYVVYDQPLTGTRELIAYQVEWYASTSETETENWEWVFNGEEVSLEEYDWKEDWEGEW